jgi:hypothetical protein
MSEPIEFQGYYFEVVIYFEEDFDEPLTNTLFIPCGQLSHEFIKSSIKKRGMVYDNPPILARIHVYDVWGEDWDFVDHNRVIVMNSEQCKHVWKWY